MQLLVLGMHRSGTSLITRLVNMMGAYFGPEGIAEAPQEANPKGYWERKDVNRINKALLEANGCSWYDLTAWPEDKPTPAPELVRQLRLLVLNMDAHRPWVMKDPRMCITLPYWLPALEVPVVIGVYRNPREIAQSLATRNQLPLPVGLALWEYHAVHMLNNTSTLPRVFVRHPMAINHPVQFVTTLYETLVNKLEVRGLRMPSEREIRAFVEKKLYRAKATEVKGIPLTPFQESLCAMLKQEIPYSKRLTVSAASVVTLRDYIHSDAVIKLSQ